MNMPPTARLSADVWTHILHFLENLDVFRLWLTGSIDIRGKLGSLGGWKVAVWDEDDPYPIIDRWPRWLLPQLSGLIALHLRSISDKCLSSQLRPTISDLENLSRSLLDLQLDFVDAICDSDVASLPPNLTRLSLPYNTRISHEGLMLLPLTMQSLLLPRNQRITKSSYLPRGLIEYSGNSGAMVDSEENLCSMPPQLMRLELIHAPESNPGWKLSSLGALRLSVPNLAALCINLCIEPETSQLQGFPPSLVELHIVGIHCDFPRSAIPLLPACLNKFVIRPQQKFHCLDWKDEDISLLPRELTVLEICPLQREHGGHSLTSDFFPLLPPSLTYLSMLSILPPAKPQRQPLAYGSDDEEDSRLTKELWRLPPSITHLNILMLAQAVESINSFAHLPPAIKRVNLRAAWNVANPSPPAPSAFPESVSFGSGDQYGVTAHMELRHRRRLPAKAVDQCYVWGQQNGIFNRAKYLSVHAPSAGILNLLGKQLVALTLKGSFTMNDELLLLLPDGLEELCLFCNDSLTDEAIPALPHDLRHLELPFNTTIEGNIYPWPLKLRKLRLGSARSRPYNPCFPPFVTNLSLRSGNFEDASAQWLPRFITRLELEEAAVTGACLPHLPPNLVKLNAALMELVDDDVALLPRSLTKFDASRGCTSLTNASAGCWPPLLRDLSFPGTFYTIEGIKNLPPTLRHIHMYSALLVTLPVEGLQPYFPSCLSYTIGHHYHSVQ